MRGRFTSTSTSPTFKRAKSIDVITRFVVPLDYRKLSDGRLVAESNKSGSCQKYDQPLGWTLCSNWVYDAKSSEDGDDEYSIYCIACYVSFVIALIKSDSLTSKVIVFLWATQAITLSFLFFVLLFIARSLESCWGNFLVGREPRFERHLVCQTFFLCTGD